MWRKQLHTLDRYHALLLVIVEPILTRLEAGLIPRWSFFISNFPSVSWQANLASSAFHPQRPEFGTASEGPAYRPICPR